MEDAPGDLKSASPSGEGGVTIVLESGDLLCEGVMLVTRARGRALEEGVTVFAVVFDVSFKSAPEVCSPTSGMEPSLLLDGEVNMLRVLEDRTDELMEAVGRLEVDSLGKLAVARPMSEVEEERGMGASGSERRGKDLDEVVGIAAGTDCRRTLEDRLEGALGNLERLVPTVDAAICTNLTVQLYVWQIGRAHV